MRGQGDWGTPVPGCTLHAWSHAQAVASVPSPPREERARERRPWFAFPGSGLGGTVAWESHSSASRRFDQWASSPQPSPPEEEREPPLGCISRMRVSCSVLRRSGPQSARRAGSLQALTGWGRCCARGRAHSGTSRRWHWCYTRGALVRIGSVTLAFAWRGTEATLGLHETFGQGSEGGL